jgi:hypothetical protein
MSSGNSVIAEVKGPYNIKFKNGSHYSTKYCKFTVNGFLFGTRYFGYEGNLIVEDLTNNLTAIINVNPKDNKGFFTSLFSKKVENFPDYYKGFICSSSDIKYDKKSNTYSCDKESILSNLEGEYNNFANIDDKCVWELGNFPSPLSYRQDFTLPSDSHLRNDLVLYVKGKNEMAQYAKMTLEDIQRKDAKLRKAAKENL